MNTRQLKVMLAILVVLGAAYMLKKEVLDKVVISTAKTTTQESRITTTTTQESQTTSPTFQGTTTTLGPYELPECILMKTTCKKDRCYFGNAINRHNTKLCEQIVRLQLRDTCLNNLNSNETIENAIIEGQMFNTRDCNVYPELTVELKDETENNTLASMQTNATDEYRFEVTPEKDYGIYVKVGNAVLNQNLSNIRKGRHITDFALS